MKFLQINFNIQNMTSGDCLWSHIALFSFTKSGIGWLLEWQYTVASSSACMRAWRHSVVKSKLAILGSMHAHRQRFEALEEHFPCFQRGIFIKVVKFFKNQNFIKKCTLKLFTTSLPPPPPSQYSNYVCSRCNHKHGGPVAWCFWCIRFIYDALCECLMGGKMM